MQTLSPAAQIPPPPPIMPPELQAKRTVIIFTVGDCISEHTKEEIKRKIMTKYRWAEDDVDNVYKFPTGSTFKMTFKLTETAK